MKVVKKLLNPLRKNTSKCCEVYSGENVFDHLVDMLPNDGRNLKRPIFLIGSARSGTTITFSLLQKSPNIACLYEANKLWMNFHKERRDTNEHGDLLYASDATPEVIGYLKEKFNQYRQREGKPFLAEKDPRNSIRLDFVHKVFPDSNYIILLRNPYSTIKSLMIRHKEARALYKYQKKQNQWWRSGDGWAEQRIPGWKNYREEPVFEATLKQFAFTMKKLLNDLDLIPDHQKILLKYEDLINRPENTQESIYKFICVPNDKTTKTAVNRIFKSHKDFSDIITEDKIDRINEGCFDYFEKAGYDMIVP